MAAWLKKPCRFIKEVGRPHSKYWKLLSVKRWDISVRMPGQTLKKRYPKCSKMKLKQGKMNKKTQKTH